MPVSERIKLFRTKVVATFPGTVAAQEAADEMRLLEPLEQAELAANAEKEYQSIISRLERDFPNLEARIERLRKFISDHQYAKTEAITKAQNRLLDLLIQLERQ